jgi:hypothetical protein
MDYACENKHLFFILTSREVYCNEQIYTLYSSPDIIREIESRRKMGRACNTYGREVYTGFWWKNLREGVYLEDPDVVERIILKWILLTSNGERGQDRSGSGLGQVAGSCECGDEASGFHKMPRIS